MKYSNIFGYRTNFSMKNAHLGLSLAKIKRYSSSQDNINKVSYINKLGNEPLKFMNVGQVLKQTSSRYPDRESIVSCNEKTRLTFEETLYKVDRLAAGLLSIGLEKGDRVAIWSPNYEFWYISMLAIARAGLICVALNPAYQSSEINYCLKKVGVKAIIAPESFRKQRHYEMLKELIPQMKDAKNGQIENNSVNSVRNVIIDSTKKLDGAIQYQDLLKVASENDTTEIEKLQNSISPDSCYNIQFTSGTTGLPKAARMSHFSLVNCGYDMGKRQELDKIYSRVCVNNPLFHGYGIIITIMNALNHGATMVLPAPHFNPEESLKAILNENCNVVYGTPTMFVDLISKQRELNFKLNEIDIANTAGAICTQRLLKDIQTYLNVRKVRSIYGLTETTAAVFQSLPDDSNESLENSVGFISNHTEAKVVDVHGNVVPFGQPGELCVRGYMTLMDYYDDDEKTKEVLGADKWFKTGDQFVLYENGYGNIVGRLKEMIIRGGENLYPREIEDFLNTHYNILETHVIGLPDERMGEEVAAFIRLKDKSKPLSIADVRQFCKGKLAHFKIPRYVLIVEEFPRTLSGKTQKYKFLQTFAEQLKAAEIQIS